jgi:hypothetical protein
MTYLLGNVRQGRKDDDDDNVDGDVKLYEQLAESEEYDDMICPRRCAVS